MKGKKLHRGNNSLFISMLFIFIGVAINILMASLTASINLPIFLDTIGTVVVACVGGAFPGIVTGLLTNAISISFNSVSMYFSVISIGVAILSALYMRQYSSRGVLYKIYFAVATGVMAGGFSAFIQWYLYTAPQNDSVSNSIEALTNVTGLPYVLVFVLVNIFINIIDKSISIGIALNIVYFLPEKFKNKIKYSGWKQTPLTNEEIKYIRDWSQNTKAPMRRRLTLLLFGVTALVITIMSIIEISMYLDKDMKVQEEAATSAAKFAASVVDPYMIDTYLRYGDSIDSYRKTEEILYKIRDSAPAVVYLYVVKIEDDTMSFIFDLDAKENYDNYGYKSDRSGYKNGATEPLAKEFYKYRDRIENGEIIPPTKVRVTNGWMMTSLYPVFNAKGKCVCYAAADASVKYITDYIFEFMWKVILIMLGIVLTILAYGMWSTSMYLVNPISQMSLGVESFIKAGDNQADIDKAVKELRKIDVHTDDEVEKLYKCICDMALNQAEQIRSVRRITEHTTKMQDGLIVTMADLVEKSDVNKGSHIQKTSAYVKIIVEGLQQKGYYLGKVNAKFISDVVRSAPLHDIGKINIPDSILKKKGPLTNDEREILKTHTIAGKKIMENAISTVSGENYLKEARNMAAYHHERWDGTGYPEGLHGEIIPLSARIMAVANTFDALTSGEFQGKEYSFEEAVSYIEEGAGTLFDPKCVDVFMDSLPEIRVIYKKYNGAFGSSML